MDFDSKQKGCWNFLKNLRKVEIAPQAELLLDALLETFGDKKIAQLLLVTWLAHPGFLQRAVSHPVFLSNLESAGRENLLPCRLPLLQRAILDKLIRDYRMHNYGKIVDAISKADLAALEGVCCGSGA